MRQLLLARYPFLCAALALTLALALATGCRSTAGDRTAAFQTEQETLEGIVSADMDLDALLKRADEQAASGDRAGAAALLEHEGIPRADAALARARAAVVASPWAVARREEWLGVLTDRRAELPRYAAALRQDDLDLRLAAIQEEVELEKRAMAAAVAVSQGAPNGDSTRRSP
jgi:hypothetical protein